jgi:hypothetical protein
MVTTIAVLALTASVATAQSVGRPANAPQLNPAAVGSRPAAIPPGVKPQMVMVKVRVDSEHPEFEGSRAMDGDPGSMWHTDFGGGQTRHPHEIIVDLGKTFEISGFSQLPRPGGGNGTIKDFDCYLSDNDKNFGKPIIAGVMPQKTLLSVIQFPAKANGRYFKLRALSEVGGQPWTSIAELKILSEGYEFRAAASTVAGLPFPTLRPRTATDASDPLMEWEDQYEVLQQDLRRRVAYGAQAFRQEALVLPGDHDPLEIVLRRTEALAVDLKRMPKAPSLADPEQELARLHKVAQNSAVEDTEARFKLFVEACKLRRQIALANPLLNFDQLLFIKRHRSTFDHMCDQYYGITARPGGGLYVLSRPFGPSPQLRDVLADAVVQSGRLQGQKLTTGCFVSPSLSYDGKTILFAYVECRGKTAQVFHVDPARGHWDEGRSYHVFKVNVDGSNLVQLTDGTWNDFAPCWLPNGRIAFITERRGGYLRCGRECPTYTLYDMAADGSDIRPLSVHETNEWHPSVTHDGRIIYTRWDYVDRHGCTAHMPWVTTLDGRDSRAVHGNFAPRGARPDMELNILAIPGSPRYVATAAPHHGQAFGSLVIIDPNVPDDDLMAPVKRLTPDVAFPESQGGTETYGTAWPLSEDYYLCAYDASMTASGRVGGRKGNYGIYLVDSFGNKELLYRDPQIACQSPIPLRAQLMPPVVPEGVPQIAADQIQRLPGTRQVVAIGGQPAEGTMALINAYDSLRAWPAGSKIRSLRVIQVLPMTVPSGGPPHEVGLREPSAGDSVVLCRKVLGTVPVEEDGSAHFIVPAQKEVLFQALDERGLAIQSMRSVTYVQPGERLVCQGCHEQRHRAPRDPASTPLALGRAPSRPVPDVDGTNPFSYPRLVQPVLDKHCVACHAKESSKAPTLAREPITRNWYASFNTLVPKYAFYSYGNSLHTVPGRFGARASKLLEILNKGHYDTKLSPEELHRLTVWMDCCSIFYGVYEREGGQAQLRGEVALPTLE